MTVVIAPGTCRHCGCTEERACRLHTGDPCCWVDRTRLVCSNPACGTAEAGRKAAARLAARTDKPKSPYAGWGYGAIVADKRRQERRARRSKGRVA